MTCKPFLLHVKTLKFYRGYAGYREIDVIGAVAVPEPAGIALAGLLGARCERS